MPMLEIWLTGMAGMLCLAWGLRLLADVRLTPWSGVWSVALTLPLAAVFRLAGSALAGSGLPDALTLGAEILLLAPAAIFALGALVLTRLAMPRRMTEV